MVAAAVICAETDERARFLAGSGALSFLRLRAGRPGPMPSPQEAADYPYNELERAFIEDRLATQMVHDPADRLASFERVAALAAAPGVSARG